MTPLFSFDKHLNHIAVTLPRFIDAKLKLSIDKCEFAADEAAFLGYTVSSNGVSPYNNKVNIIKQMQFPQKNHKNMSRFLGAFNYYRDFLPWFSYIASLLYKMAQSTYKYKAASNSSIVFKAFDKLKNSLISATVLCFPNFKQLKCMMIVYSKESHI